MTTVYPNGVNYLDVLEIMREVNVRSRVVCEHLSEVPALDDVTLKDFQYIYDIMASAMKTEVNVTTPLVQK